MNPVFQGALDRLTQIGNGFSNSNKTLELVAQWNKSRTIICGCCGSTSANDGSANSGIRVGVKKDVELKPSEDAVLEKYRRAQLSDATEKIVTVKELPFHFQYAIIQQGNPKNFEDYDEEDDD